MPDNTITIAGNVSGDPELKFTNSGQASIRFGVAVNRRWQNKQTQEWEERVSFFNVQAWGPIAENVANSLSKGNRVIVSGRLEQRSWETDKGEKRSVVEINADEIGPSLRWATAVVEKNPRAEGGYTPKSSGANRGGAGQFSAYDEEPF